MKPAIPINTVKISTVKNVSGLKRFTVKSKTIAKIKNRVNPEMPAKNG